MGKKHPLHDDVIAPEESPTEETSKSVPQESTAKKTPEAPKTQCPACGHVHAV